MREVILDTLANYFQGKIDLHKANIEIYHPKHLCKQKYKIIDKSKCTEYNWLMK